MWRMDIPPLQGFRESAMSENLLLSRRAAATTLGVSTYQIDCLIADKAIPSLRIGRRVFVSRLALENYITASALGDSLSRQAQG